jgi:hypothetical protein
MSEREGREHKNPSSIWNSSTGDSFISLPPARLHRTSEDDRRLVVMASLVGGVDA